MKSKSKYKVVEPSPELKELVHSFWTHRNKKNEPQKLNIFPDSFFKIVLVVTDGKIEKYFMSGLWLEPKEITITPKSTVYGCRLKLLAPEYLLGIQVIDILNSVKQLDLSYLNLNQFELTSFKDIVSQWEKELLKIKPNKEIQGNKLRLSQLLYTKNGSITAKEVSEQIFWSNRQISRYLNKYLGVSLKKYLNVQKCYKAYIQIREGEFFPKMDYFDQAHFIKEIKKHTGETPKSLFKHQKDRFIQLKNIKQR